MRRTEIGRHHLSGLAIGPDGMLVGTSSEGEFLVVDPIRRSVVTSVSVVLDADWTAGWGHAARTWYDPDSDCYLLTQANRLVQVSRDLSSVGVVAHHVEQVTRAGNGRYFGVDDTNLYLLEPR